MTSLKPFLDHELLNLLTLINMIVSTEDIDPATKLEVAHLIKLSSLITSNHEFFEKGEKEFFMEDVSLQEVIDIIFLMYEKSFQEKGIMTESFEEIFLVKSDKNLLKDLLEVLVKKLMITTKSIRFAFRKAENKLVLFYDGVKFEFEEKEPLACLKESLAPEEIIFQMTLKFARISGLDIQQKEGKIEIHFPKKG